ncbi:MAG: alpha/beta fold hydrolase [Nocardioidaceae bacterium]
MTEATVSVGNDIDICYETFGEPSDPTVLLIMGLSGPMNWWSTDLCELIASRGYHVVRYDNRDTGASSVLRDRRVGRSDVVRAFLGDRRHAPYGLGDLADDAFGLLDAIDVDRAHLVGVSMGGMIAQTMAIARPERVLSLTSMMSTTGRRSVGWQHPRLFPMLLARTGHSRAEYVRRSLATQRLIGSPGFERDLDEHRARAEETYDRGWSASGVLRQMLAVLTQRDRTRDLRRLDLPTCVVHGLVDPMVHVSGGRATALAVRGSELVLIPGLAHDLPKALNPTFADAIDRTARRSQSRPARPTSSDSSSSR